MDCYRMTYHDFMALVDNLNMLGQRVYGYQTKNTEDWTPEMVLRFQFTDGHRLFVLDEDVTEFSNDAIALVAKSIYGRFSDDE